MIASPHAVAHGRTLSGRGWAQRPEELLAFLTLLQSRNVRRYLEIGCRDGDTLYAVASVLAPGAELVGIDLPASVWGRKGSQPNLEVAAREARRLGHRVTIHYADSQQQATRDLLGGQRFDAILIDADHRYPGVLRDWQLYGPLGRLVAFHDIVGDGEGRNGWVVEVPRLWREIVASGAETVEFVAPGSVMGIGVVFR